MKVYNVYLEIVTPAGEKKKKTIKVYFPGLDPRSQLSCVTERVREHVAVMQAKDWYPAGTKIRATGSFSDDKMSHTRDLQDITNDFICWSYPPSREFNE